jgi:enoyl-CoA hydratase
VEYEAILVDDPAPMVRRVTLNRPEKRNALNQRIRVELLDALHAADADPDVRVMIVRGAGPSFCSGYDLSGMAEPDAPPVPFYSAGGDGAHQRMVVEAWTSIWDLAKPVIAQVHGYCLAGGSELATGCDLVYVAEDAHMGYPAVRFGTPDTQFHAWFVGMRTAMEMMVTGDSISGVEAVQRGWANRAFPAGELDDRVLEIAVRITATPTDIVQMNKRTVHRAMEIMGLRTAIRAGTELSALAAHQATFRRFMDDARSRGVSSAVATRDAPYRDAPRPGDGGAHT